MGCIEGCEVGCSEGCPDGWPVGLVGSVPVAICSRSNSASVTKTHILDMGLNPMAGWTNSLDEEEFLPEVHRMSALKT